ncbi:methionyl-tRNA formyltransferase [Verrucomicrobium sp. GAS474]|uniref:methionyl-tRNA formyltransferase n=1 Tax=Verrucomicrobium sp. GAS474 TaxID=1882831 RepID=UPI00087AE2EE|nr:methionyl-tRNA formyltransferase [Verrucomicrobium sp. GAS474]SDT87769.1 methionyl-tRNA formyltransferase [Verrucomicrobium sp. GAS474]
MKVVFIGTSEFGVPALDALVASPEHTVVGVVTQPDRPVGRQQKMTPSPIKEAAFKHHLKIFQPEQIKRDSVIKQIAYLRPDVIVVAAYGQILPKVILDLPQYGCLNLHASILPKFRGASPIQSAILAREKKSGVTVMWMNEGLDTGDVLLVGETPIKADDTAQTLHDRLALIGAKSLLTSLALIKKGKATRTSQSDLGVAASYAKKLTKEDGRIDWTKGKRDIDAHIRAMTPWPSAYTWVPDNMAGGTDQKMLKIFTTIFSHRAKGKPGEVVRVDKHGVLVSTGGTGGLLLREVQLEGKKRMHAAEFARGFNLAVGTILG